MEIAQPMVTVLSAAVNKIKGEGSDMPPLPPDGSVNRIAMEDSWGRGAFCTRSTLCGAAAPSCQF